MKNILRILAVLALCVGTALAQNQSGSVNSGGTVASPVTKLVAGSGISLSPASGTGTVTVTNTDISTGIFTGLNGQTITGDVNGAWAVAANGTNQNITLTPSGTGQVNVVGAAGSSGIVQQWTRNTFTTQLLHTGSFSQIGSTNAPLQLFGNNSVSIHLPGNAHTLLGGLSTDGTGVLQFPAATTNAGGINFGTEIFFFRTGTNTAQISASAGLALTGKVTTYNNVSTAGMGVGVVVANPRQTAVTNTTATLATYTVPAADSTYRISANVQVTAATTAAMTVVCTYTDETNTARSQTLPFCQLAGTFLTSITNVTGAGPYEGATLQIRCKASTTIVFTTAGTVTGITYNVEGLVIQGS